MRRALITIISCILVITVNANLQSSMPPLRASEVFIPIGNTGQLISLQELSTISMKDLQTLVGKKVSFSEKLVFKSGQKKLRSFINSDGTLNQNFGNALLGHRGLFTNISW